MKSNSLKTSLTAQEVLNVVVYSGEINVTQGDIQNLKIKSILYTRELPAKVTIERMKDYTYVVSFPASSNVSDGPVVAKFTCRDFCSEEKIEITLE